MSLPVLLVVAVVTVGSRIAAMALLPPPRGRASEVVERLPAPLFAALAALSLSGPGMGDPAMLAAVACALVAARRPSLLLVLAAGMSGYLVVRALGG